LREVTETAKELAGLLSPNLELQTLKFKDTKAQSNAPHLDYPDAYRMSMPNMDCVPGTIHFSVFTVLHREAVLAP
jgi:hypothetical protein